MASTISIEQRRYLQGLLARDLNSNHQLLTYYLKLILSNRPIELNLPDKTKLKLSPEEAWQEITTWAADNEISLPMGDRGSRKIRASRLLNYLELNVQGKSREAAANFRSILDSVNDNPLKNLRPETTEGQAYKKANELRNLQYKLINDKILGKLTTRIQQTQYLKRFAGDPHTFSVLSGLLAADAANLRPAPGKSTIAVAEEIAKLIQLRSGDGDLNNASHLAYSAKADQELPELTSAIEAVIQQEYGSSPEGQTAFRADMSRLSSLPQLTTIADIPTLVDLVAGHDQNKDKLVESLRKNIIATTTSGFVSGEVLIRESLKSAGFPDTAFAQLSTLAPLIEEVRQNEVAKILGGNVLESDPRLLHTLGLTRDLGISLDTPWLTAKDLDRQRHALEEKYESQDLSAFLQTELAKDGGSANFQAVVEIRNHFSHRSEYERYKYALDHDVLFSIRDRIARARGNFAATKAPIDRFTQKIGKNFWAVDDFIHSPFNYIAEKWERLEEKIPILNPGKLINDKLTLAQLWVADKVLTWSSGAASSATKGGKWYAGIFTHISDFSKAYIDAGASWGHASFSFVEKKWGNLLDWSAKTLAHKESFAAVKVAVANRIWGGFKKLAPGVAEKLSGGALGKVVTSFLAGTLSAGTTLLIQAALFVVWEGVKGSWKFITDKAFRNNLVAGFTKSLPFVVSAASAAVLAVPVALVGWIIATGSAALGALGALISGLFTTILVPALITVGAIIAGFFLFYQIFNMTANTDSGLSSLIASAICEQSTLSNPSATANVALCIAELADKCPGVNPMTQSVVESPSWQCFVGGLVFKNAIVELEKSSKVKNNAGASEGNVQCVGLSAASAADGDGPFSVGQINACSYATQVPKGYSYLPGCPNMQPGDHFIMGVDRCGQTVGHIGVVIDPNVGTGFSCVDANFSTPGQIRGPTTGCVFAKSQISGCLRRM